MRSATCSASATPTSRPARQSTKEGKPVWLDALHGTSKVYFDARKKREAQFGQAQAQWEATALELKQR